MNLLKKKLKLKRMRHRRKKFRSPFVKRHEYDELARQLATEKARTKRLRDALPKQIKRIDDFVADMVMLRSERPIDDAAPLFTVSMTIDAFHMLPALRAGDDAMIDYIAQSLMAQLVPQLRRMNHVNTREIIEHPNHRFRRLRTQVPYPFDENL